MCGNTNTKVSSVLVTLSKTEVEILVEALKSYKEEMFDVCRGEETEDWYKSTLALLRRFNEEVGYFSPDYVVP